MTPNFASCARHAAALLANGVAGLALPPYLRQAAQPAGPRYCQGDYTSATPARIGDNRLKSAWTLLHGATCSNPHKIAKKLAEARLCILQTRNFHQEILLPLEHQQARQAFDF